MKRSPLKRKTPLKTKTGFKKPTGTLGRKSPKKTTQAKNKPIKTISTPVPNWIKAIPESKAHGAGTYQKRLWKLTSDYVRIRDFYKYGRCAATGEHFSDWKSANVQAGHLKNYATCNGLYKFDVRNIHAQTSRSNRFPTYDDHMNFRAEVEKRGYDWDLFEKENNANNGCRLYDSDVIKALKELLHKMKELPEQPEYFERAYNLLCEQ